jgi:hypothetical protein
LGKGKGAKVAGGAGGAAGGSWKNEIEVWDVRRPYFPKLAIKTDEPTSSASLLPSFLSFPSLLETDSFSSLPPL